MSPKLSAAARRGGASRTQLAVWRGHSRSLRGRAVVWEAATACAAAGQSGLTVHRQDHEVEPDFSEDNLKL